MKTCTVAELRAFLSKFPDDMLVVGTWEGIHVPVDLASSGLGPVPDVGQDCLVLDVENF